MSSKEFPSCAYDVCAEFDCEETMALALIATRNELARTRKALDVAVDALREMERWLGVIRGSMVSHLNNKNNTLLEHYNTDPTVQNIDKAKKILKNQLNEITALEQKDK